MKLIAATIVAFMLGGYQIADSSYYVAPIQEIIQEPVVIKQVCIVTAYSQHATMGGRDDGITASGIYGIPNVSCAMENVPFGTKIKLPDGRVFEVHDRFGHEKDGYIDLYLFSEEECWEWGRKEMEVEIVEN